MDSTGQNKLIKRKALLLDSIKLNYTNKFTFCELVHTSLSLYQMNGNLHKMHSIHQL